MRYLYGDSTPFPRDYDMLASLRGFVRCAGACLKELAEIEELETRVAKRSAASVRALNAIDRFAKSVTQTVDVSLEGTRSTDAMATFAERVLRFVAEASEQTRGQLRDELRDLEARSRATIEEHRKGVAAAMERFLLDEQLDILSTRTRMEWRREGYSAVCTCALPHDMEVTYRLETGSTPEWQHPRQVGDFTGAMLLQVGMKKKWLSRALTREIARIDEQHICAAELEGNRARLHLRRKPETGEDTFVLLLHKDGDGAVSCEILRPTERDEGASFHAVPDDIEKLASLWNAVEQACNQLLAHRIQVEGLFLDGEDVLDRALVRSFVERFVHLYTPVVTEISRRSPSRRELSLKIEHDDGRREEIYLDRSELVEPMAELDERLQGLLAPLDIFPDLQEASE